VEVFMVAAADILWGGVLPALAAAATMVGAWRLSRSADVAWLTGLTLGFLVGYWGLDAQGVGFWTAVAKMARPLEARDWLPLAVLSAAAIEALSLWPRCPAVLSWVLRVAWCCFLPWRLLSGSVYLPQMEQDFGFDTGAWSTLVAMAWLGGASVVLALLWLAMRLMPERTLPRLRASLTSLVALGATATIALSGSLTTGQLLGVLTAVLVGCGIVAATLRLERGPEAGAGPLVAVYGGVLVIARFLLSPELPLFATSALLVAMIAAVAWIDPPSWLPKRGQGLIRIAVCLVALALTVIPAAREFAASQADEQNDPYLNFQP
jgi:hypothetical protein